MFDDIELPVWRAGSNFAAVFVAGPVASVFGELSVVTPGGRDFVPFELEAAVEVTQPAGTIAQSFLDVLENRVLTEDIRDLIESFYPEHIAELDLLDVLKTEFEQLLSQMGPGELALVESGIEASGFLRFAQENPSLVFAETSNGAGGLLTSPPPNCPSNNSSFNCGRCRSIRSNGRRRLFGPGAGCDLDPFFRRY